jgi:hypothetical protein
MRNTLLHTVATSLAVIALGVSLATTPVLAAPRHGGGSHHVAAVHRGGGAAHVPICRASVWRRWRQLRWWRILQRWRIL